VLPRLTADDLKELGVSTVGDRRLLLDAIADLRSSKRSEQAPSAAPVTAQDTAAERRQVTVMKAVGMLRRGSALALTGRTSDALPTMITGINGWRSTGTTMLMPLWLINLARAYAVLGQFDDAWSCVGEAITTIKTTKERLDEAEVHRNAGEIALMTPGMNLIIIPWSP
jgi:hypothetical protein